MKKSPIITIEEMTPNSPAITLNQVDGFLKIEGSSNTRDPNGFWGLAKESIDKLSDKTQIYIVDIHFYDFDEVAFFYVASILSMFERTDTEIRWHYEKHDLTMKEYGEKLQDTLYINNFQVLAI